VSIDLILEVMDHAPADLTPGERMVLTVIAERANEKTRIAKQTSNWTIDTIAKRSGVGRDGLRKIFQRLAKNGCEVRVKLGTDSRGRPVFAYEGTAMTFKVPKLAKRGDACTASNEKRGDDSTATDAQEVVPQSARGGTTVPERRDGSTTQTLMTLKEPSKNSSLSARTSVTAAREQADTRERDESTPSEEPNLTPEQRIVIGEGCPAHLAAPVVEIIETSNPGIRGIGWWKRVRDEGDLKRLHIPAALATLSQPPGHTAGPHCHTCNDTGKTTIRSVYEGDTERVTDCGDCTNNGKGRCRFHPTLPAHTCGSCRADRHDPNREYGQLDQQARTSQRAGLPARTVRRPTVSQSSEGRNYDGWTQDVKAQILAEMAAHNYPQP
jgi:predicted ArsR family transcriptional regulator